MTRCGGPMMNRIVNWFKQFGLFSVGMFLGTCYGAVVATFASYLILHR